MTRLTCILVLIFSLGAANSFAADPDTPTGPARLDGEWKLDWDRSESFEPVMKALETPWLLRRLAGVIPVGVEFRAAAAPSECVECARKVMMTVDTPIANQEIELILDGKPRPGEDLQGRPTLDRYSWMPEAGLRIIREFKLPSGRQARIVDVRDLDLDTDMLLSQMTVWVDDTERASIKRTYLRTSD